MSKKDQQPIVDKKRLLRKMDHITIPPRMEGKVKNAGIKQKQKPKKQS